MYVTQTKPYDQSCLHAVHEGTCLILVAFVTLSIKFSQTYHYRSVLTFLYIIQLLLPIASYSITPIQLHLSYVSKSARKFSMILCMITACRFVPACWKLSWHWKAEIEENIDIPCFCILPIRSSRYHVITCEIVKGDEHTTQTPQQLAGY